MKTLFVCSLDLMRTCRSSILMLLLAWTMPLAAEEEAATSSILLRAVTVTYDLEKSVHFYRDILGQEVVTWEELDPERSSAWLDISPEARVTFVVLAGSGEYPGGVVTGGRIGFVGIEDPAYQRESRLGGGRGKDGDMILPHRVSNLDTIYEKIQAAELEVLFPPRVTGTGLSRNMMVIDPNGHIVELFELFPGRPPEE